MNEHRKGSIEYLLLISSIMNFRRNQFGVGLQDDEPIRPNDETVVDYF